MSERKLVRVAAYSVCRLPDDTSDFSLFEIRVEAAGHGRWAVRWLGKCLNKNGEWEYEPSPSNREDDWLGTVRWDEHLNAIAAAVAAEPHLRVNGLSPVDVLARRTST